MYLSWWSLHQSISSLISNTYRYWNLGLTASVSNTCRYWSLTRTLTDTYVMLWLLSYSKDRLPHYEMVYNKVMKEQHYRYSEVPHEEQLRNDDVTDPSEAPVDNQQIKTRLNDHEEKIINDLTVINRSTREEFATVRIFVSVLDYLSWHIRHLNITFASNHDIYFSFAAIYVYSMISFINTVQHTKYSYYILIIFIFYCGV